MICRIGALAVVVIAASVLTASPAVAQDAEATDAPATTVRIKARKVETGKVEFGLQLDGEGEWLPRARLFPYPTAKVGQWLFASPYTMGDGTSVRIQARLLANGSVEFGLQVDGDQVWLPRARFFQYDTVEVGRWLFASPFSLLDEIGRPASAPRNLRVTAVVCDVTGAPHSMRLDWDPPSSSGGTRVTAYEVTRLRAAETGFTPLHSDPGVDDLVPGSSHTDSDVLISELYEWSVQALNRAGRGAAATVQSIFEPSYVRNTDPWGDRAHYGCDETATPLPGASRPEAPRNLRATLNSAEDAVIMRWSAPHDGGDRITSYEVGDSALGASSPGYGRKDTGRGPLVAVFDLGGATSGAKTYWVRAVNSHGRGPWASVDIRF